MTGAEARHLLDVIGAQWSRPIPIPAQPLWLNFLLRCEVEEITQALGFLAERSRFAPALAEIVEVVKIQRSTRALSEPPCSICGGDHLVQIDDDGYVPCPGCHPTVKERR